MQRIINVYVKTARLILGIYDWRFLMLMYLRSPIWHVRVHLLLNVIPDAWPNTFKDTILARHKDSLSDCGYIAPDNSSNNKKESSLLGALRGWSAYCKAQCPSA